MIAKQFKSIALILMVLFSVSVSAQRDGQKIGKPGKKAQVFRNL